MSENPSQFLSFDATGQGFGRQKLLFGQSFFGLARAELAALMVAAGEPAWRGRQLAEALYRQRLVDLSEITTLPKPLRQRLVGEGWQVGRPQIAQVFQSVDGTERYLIQNPKEAETVETVWMPEGDDSETGDESDADNLEMLGAPGLDFETWESNKPQPSYLPIPPTLGAPSLRRLFEEKAGARVGKLKPGPQAVQKERMGPEGAEKSRHRATICVSSQVGCAVNCQFCLTAQLSSQRNLTAGEIAGQVLAVFDRHGVEVGRDRVNLVFMGMGEPFLNYDNFMGAVRLLVEEVGLSPQRMTVSTSGIVPGIERFAQEPAEVRPKLAISLNAPNDEIRSQIMPINRQWPIEAVMEAARGLRLRSRERITFEYVLLGGVTDRPEHAAEVARLLRRTGLPVKVNLIAWNPGPGINYAAPQPEAVEAFRRTLTDAGIPTYLRRPRGRDIFAACGQLKRTVEE